MRSFDWSQTVLGSPQSWPLNLRTCVRIILTSRQPMFIWWGEQLIHLYNDGYMSILGAKHPAALAQPAPVVWSEVWDVAGPRAEFAMHRDEGTYDEALPFIMLRNGYPEETYVTFSYSPIPDDRGGFGGILCPAAEDTQRIIGERQLALLRELPARTADARTWRDACRLAAKAIETNPNDLPFALIYSIDGKDRSASLVATSANARINKAAPATLRLDGPGLWPLGQAYDKREACLVSDMSAVSDALPLVLGYPVQQAIVLPIAPSGEADMNAVLVAGLNPLRPLDGNYRNFLDMVAGAILAAMVNAESYEAERRRAEALAALDHAKTVFFSNVSHEFRTPLTLILGPLEDALAAPETSWPRERIEMLHRNALRLQKLVNTLLDFSRIEAGRIQASYVPTSLAEFTAELASGFRSAVERAGMRLIVDCPALDELVYVDRDMYEKVVLNLISNAFKFTLEGEIEVRLQDAGSAVELSVRDTGTGIAHEQLPHIFERFHRIEGAPARTHEGTGIGLALVEQLVRLHGGSVSVGSVPGQGSTFTVSIPKGKAHLPAARIGPAHEPTSTALHARRYVEEALSWLPSDAATVSPSLAANNTDVAPLGASPMESAGRARIVWADDNADMRDYVKRLLAPWYDVETAHNGETALACARREPPELVLADVMMPVLDGFGLLHALRADERTREVPVILLSARAGEEARVEGMQAGADDYLTKPFSARELLARVDAHIKLSRQRARVTEALRASEMRLRTVIDQLPAGVGVMDRNGTWTLRNE
jgi:signal transduction histidine kinase/CheY-like chemotaxis protein